MPRRTDIPISSALRDALAHLRDEHGSSAALAARLGVGVDAFRRAMAGEPVLAITAVALKAGVDLLVDGEQRHRLLDGGLT
jgi:hypothetical protein